MSQSKWYRGTDAFVVCQAPSFGTQLCWKPVRSKGVGMISGHASRIYECVEGHRFALTDVRKVRGPHPFAQHGELDDDVSGESGAGRERSGESGESHGGARRITPTYTDYRKVTILERSRPVFGDVS
jgi:hypothetical protein